MLNGKLLDIDKKYSYSYVSDSVRRFKESHPGADIVSLGVGDVSFPVPSPVAEAMKKACGVLTDMKSFHGYGELQGLLSLRKAIADNDYRGLDIDSSEIWIGDGTKTDCSSILELFGEDCRVLTGDVSYQVYRNGAFALGKEVFFAECDEDEGPGRAL